MVKQVRLDSWEVKALDAIEREDEVCFDVAVDCGQIFDNVKHMTWFVKAVADQLYADDTTVVNPSTTHPREKE